jgi:hypothetical protein
VFDVHYQDVAWRSGLLNEISAHILRRKRQIFHHLPTSLALIRPCRENRVGVAGEGAVLILALLCGALFCEMLLPQAKTDLLLQNKAQN